MYVCVGCVVSLFAKCDFSHLLLGGTARDGGQEIIELGVQSTLENENRFQNKFPKKSNNISQGCRRCVFFCKN